LSKMCRLVFLFINFIHQIVKEILVELKDSFEYYYHIAIKKLCFS
jgi:hypothetical protein